LWKYSYTFKNSISIWFVC